MRLVLQVRVRFFIMAAAGHRGGGGAAAPEIFAHGKPTDLRERYSADLR
jgi:hypothetical protein